MAFPIIYIDTGGSLTNSGSSDNNAAAVSGANAACNPSSTTVSLITDAPNLSAVPTDGSATIYLAGATNTNMKIFQITAVDDTLKTVTVSVAPTGNFTGSQWAIGGRILHSATSVGTLEGALAPGWSVQFNNSPAAIATSILTQRTDGDVATGPISVYGKTGARPLLNTTGNVGVIANSGNRQFWRIENLEVDSDGASAATLGFAQSSSGNHEIYNVKVSDGGGYGISIGGGSSSVTLCEVSGTSGGGIQGASNSANQYYGNYVHDLTGVGINAASSSSTNFGVIANIIDTCTGQGIFQAQTGTLSSWSSIINNTVYNCGDSGFQAEKNTRCIMFNNIFHSNGDAAGEYNVEFTAGTLENSGRHGYNCFYTAGAGGSGNLSGATANSTETTSDPSFTNPANGDFSLQSGSPCKGTGFPGTFLGGPTGYMDMGAVQRQEPASGVIGSRIQLGS